MRSRLVGTALGVGLLLSVHHGAVAQLSVSNSDGATDNVQAVPRPVDRQSAGDNPYTFEPLNNPYKLTETTTTAQAPAKAGYDPAAPAAGCTNADKGFVERLKDAYVDHINYDPNAPGTPQRAGYQDPPLSTPPYPSATWNIGGTVPIGYDALYKGPLTDTLWCGPYGSWMKENRLTVYGWAEPSFNISTSNRKFSQSQGVGGNFPSAYDPWPNTVQLNQVALYFEKTPDTVQTDHNDWGFRIANLYGTDYRYTFAKGYLSNQFIKDRDVLGYDPVMFYADFYFPGVAQGMNVRVGRYISIPDIEAQLAPNNYTFTHSLLYSFDPYTHTGVVTTIKFNQNWTAQFEISASNDVSPLSTTYAQPTPGACLNWTSDSGNDNIYPCINGLNNGRYGYNNVQMLVATWYHKFDSRWHMSTEGWYMWENRTPNLRSSNPDPLIANANGAICKSGDSTNCTSHEWALLNYIGYQVGPFDSITLRNEILNDTTGQRTGFNTTYTEHAIGWQHWIGDVLTIRPEVRYDRSLNYAAFNFDPVSGKGSHNQVQFAADVIAHF